MGVSLPRTRGADDPAATDEKHPQTAHTATLRGRSDSRPGPPGTMTGMGQCQPAGLPADGRADPAGPPQRRAGRVIVLDPDDRVLLLRYDEEPPAGRHWATPGGGLNPGESYAAAASRELAEETGWHDLVLLGEVHQQMRLILHESRAFRQHERLFLARTGQVRRELGDVAAMH